MERKIMKKILRFLPVVALLAGVFGVATTKSDSIRADAAVTSADIRIAVVRPGWWEDDDAYQVLRLAPTTEDLTDNVVANITYVEIESYTADTYYAAGGGFTEYTTNGVVFYDIPLATITGKYFDLARLSPTDPTKATVWNKTEAELFNTTMLNKIWRIFGDGSGVFRPEGIDAESRNVSNGVINSLLYGYMTCSDSANNGYGAFKSLDTNFNLTGRTFSETDTVLDFINQSDYSMGRGAGVTVLTSNKIAMMQTMYNLSLSPARITTVDFKKNTKLVFLISLIGMSALAGFYFLKSKKQ
jgi:hypothetical protein